MMDNATLRRMAGISAPKRRPECSRRFVRLFIAVMILALLAVAAMHPVHAAVIIDIQTGQRTYTGGSPQAQEMNACERLTAPAERAECFGDMNDNSHGGFVVVNPPNMGE